MAATNSWDLLNKPRDLTDVLSTLIAGQPMFIRKFPVNPPATNRKHEWLEDVMRPRVLGYTSYNQSTGTFTVASSAALTLKLINDAAQRIIDEGGTPDIILCGQGQARVISQLMKSQINLTPTDSTRGAFVNRVIIESTGNVVEVLVEPALASMDTDVWVIDSSSLGLVHLNNRQIHTEPATTPGLDGRKYSILGEMTFEFKNAKQKICRISGLQASATTLAS